MGPTCYFFKELFSYVTKTILSYVTKTISHFLHSIWACYQFISSIRSIFTHVSALWKWIWAFLTLFCCKLVLEGDRKRWLDSAGRKGVASWCQWAHSAVFYSSVTFPKTRLMLSVHKYQQHPTAILSWKTPFSQFHSRMHSVRHWPMNSFPIITEGKFREQVSSPFPQHGMKLNPWRRQGYPARECNVSVMAVATSYSYSSCVL